MKAAQFHVFEGTNAIHSKLRQMSLSKGKSQANGKSLILFISFGLDKLFSTNKLNLPLVRSGVTWPHFLGSEVSVGCHSTPRCDYQSQDLGRDYSW